MNKNAGWRAEEESLLFEEVEKGRKYGRPLKSVFEAVSDLTGRRPNSVRNYYYLKIREDASRLSQTCSAAAFVPFSAEESRSLLRTVLTAQAGGMSVRACTLAMGGGDNKAMLRYQNKYRSLIKNDPKLVRRILDELISEGRPCFDPYAHADKKAALKKRRESVRGVPELIARVAEDLSGVKGLNTTHFFESLGALAVSASSGANEAKRLLEQNELIQRQNERLSAEFNEVKARLADRESELIMQRDRFNSLLALYRQLMSVNRELLGKVTDADATDGLG